MCAVAARAGHEDAVARRVMRAAEGAATCAYALRRAAFKREGGVWRQVNEVLFPGYVLVETADPDLLEKNLQVLARSAQLVRGAGEAVATLEPQEAALIRQLGGPAHAVEASVGCIVDGRLRVSAGPLRGLEHLVRKVDRHRRAAYLNPAAFGVLTGIRAGVAAGENGLAQAALCPSITAQRRARVSAAPSASKPLRPRMPRVALEVVSKT